jgi:hypothetical protein
MDRPGICIILDKKYNITNSSCHFGSYGSIWTGPSPNKYYMDLRSFDPYNIFLVTDRSIYCHMTLSAMNYLLCCMFILGDWLNEHKSTAAMNYFLIRIRLIDQYIPFNLNNIYLENNQNIQYIKHSKYRQDSETSNYCYFESVS